MVNGLVAAISLVPAVPLVAKWDLLRPDSITERKARLRQDDL